MLRSVYNVTVFMYYFYLLCILTSFLVNAFPKAGQNIFLCCCQSVLLVLSTESFVSLANVSLGVVRFVNRMASYSLLISGSHLAFTCSPAFGSGHPIAKTHLLSTFFFFCHLERKYYDVESWKIFTGYCCILSN